MAFMTNRFDVSRKKKIRLKSNSMGHANCPTRVIFTDRMTGNDDILFSILRNETLEHLFYGLGPFTACAVQFKTCGSPTLHHFKFRVERPSCRTA